MDRDNEISITCPVRKVTKKENEKIAGFVSRLVQNNSRVYWPKKHNPFQDTDRIGLKIYEYHIRRYLKAKTNWVWWKNKSRGSYCDLGIILAMKILGEMLEKKELSPDELVKLLKDRKIILANPKEIKPTIRKSFNNLVLKLNRLALGR